MRSKESRKFGKKRFVLIWDSATFRTARNPDTKAAIQEKLHMAQMHVRDYIDRGYHVNKTTYNKGRDFKVWGLPKD